MLDVPVDDLIAVQPEVLRVLPDEESGIRRSREGRDGLVVLERGEVRRGDARFGGRLGERYAARPTRVTEGASDVTARPIRFRRPCIVASGDGIRQVDDLRIATGLGTAGSAKAGVTQQPSS